MGCKMQLFQLLIRFHCHKSDLVVYCHKNVTIEPKVETLKCTDNYLSYIIKEGFMLVKV